MYNTCIIATSKLSHRGGHVVRYAVMRHAATEKYVIAVVGISSEWGGIFIQGVGPSKQFMPIDARPLEGDFTTHICIIRPA